MQSNRAEVNLFYLGVPADKNNGQLMRKGVNIDYVRLL